MIMIPLAKRTLELLAKIVYSFLCSRKLFRALTIKKYEIILETSVKRSGAGTGMKININVFENLLSYFHIH